ncbi:MAG TPA: DNA/RNA non-specific endonuclease [Myxococcota bacterium]|nr:DNA/RNA non-specific endonuclease [Myxococcota bacterium]HPB50018.1 DNA/RNA non-specific endonuclease [Myxococcota bacterium]HQP94981.1 DNA/RNA non-specific endonuclease [Myxococcota bacterium]
MRHFGVVAPVLAVVVGVVMICQSGTSEVGQPFDGAQGRPSTGQDPVGANDIRPSGQAIRPSGQDGQVYGGLPVSLEKESRYVLLDNLGFDVGYSEYRQNPVWVGYMVGPDTVEGGGARPQRFSTDARTESRVAHRDYTRTGYDRGHLAPNHAIATRYGRKAQLETFMMSNIVPQRPALNRQVWQRIEALEADRWSSSLGGVWVITGPVFDRDREFLKQSQPRIEIPDAFFKVIVDEVEDTRSGTVGPRVLAFIVEQDVQGDEMPVEFLVSVDWIEERTGLDLMPDLNDEIEVPLEAGVADSVW